MERNVNYIQVFPDVCPEPLRELHAGKVKNGMFYPSGSVSKYYFYKQREYIANNKKEQNKYTNVYFIQAVAGGNVKIGIAKNISARIKQLQTASPTPLKIIKVYKNVSPSFERELHERYKQYRLCGEWFTDEILNDIGECND